MSYIKSKRAVKIFLLISLIASVILIYSACVSSSEYKKPPDIILYTFNTADSTPTLSPTATVTPPTASAPTPKLEAHCVPDTNPEKFKMKTEIMVNGSIVEKYNRENPIFFDNGDKYAQGKGVYTFRGNNYRDSGAVYGIQNIKEGALSSEPIWKKKTGSKQGIAGSWSGFGWTGQPLVTEWPKSTRAAMKMFDWAKTQDTLVEVIAASQDGCIYFYELETGKATRDPIVCDYPFKGAGALDPRGIPLFYVGGGDRNMNYSSPRAYVISLVTNEIIYEFGNDDTFAHRKWCAFDSSPLVDAETDTLIWPGESGICYFIKLGTSYDESAGTLSVSPSEIVKWRYSGARNSDEKFWYGIEGSAIAYQEYLYVADNGGYMMCLNMNTLELIWVQDLLDDTNCTGVLEVENGKPYIYISTAYHYGWRTSRPMAEIPIVKLDAQTGEIVWKTSYDCYTINGNSGGVQGSFAIGKGNLENMIFVPLARTPGDWNGLLVALDKTTGREIWSTYFKLYLWSSPTVIYDNATGKAYIIQTHVEGMIYVLDALSGEILYSYELDGVVEASPVIYNNVLLIGTRNCSLYAFEIK